jgi:hypothetical protein
MDDFGAGFVTDLTYISGVRLWGGPFSVSYGALYRALQADSQLWPEVRHAKPLDILGLRRDERMSMRVAEAVTTYPRRQRLGLAAPLRRVVKPASAAGTA